MAVFHLKLRDTRPVLRVNLLNPDGTPHDLTGVDAVHLHVLLTSGVLFSREMTIEGSPLLGEVGYSWVAADWSGSPALVASPSLPPPKGTLEHRMEYEVISGTSRLTFPNNAYDILRVLADLGQG